jgi:hypothetical protein
MFVTAYQMYVSYRYLVAFHGIYVTLSFLSWVLGSTYTYSMWMVSFVYDPYPLPQLEDRKSENKDT